MKNQTVKGYIGKRHLVFGLVQRLNDKPLSHYMVKKLIKAQQETDTKYNINSTFTISKIVEIAL